MAKLYNLARMTTATTGTGTITLGSAVPSYVSFANSGVSNGETVTYAIVDGNNREVGRGVYTASGTTLTRTVLESTNSNNPINLSGNAEVFITAAAEDIANVGETNTFTASQIINVTDNSNPALRVTQLGTGLAIRVEDSANPDASPFVVTADGNVGIGVAAPTARLELYTNAASTVSMNTGNSQGTWTYGVDSAGNASIYSNSAKNILMSTSGTERLRISDAGVSTITGTAIINSTSATDALRITQTGNGNAILVEDSANPDSTPFVVTNEGRVGIGEDIPSFYLQVAAPNASTQTQMGLTSTNYTSDFKSLYMVYSDSSTTGTTYGITNANLGSIRFQNTANALIGTNGGSPLILATTSLERLRIASDGKVGIGTTAPDALLSVNGVASFGAGSAAAPSVSGFGDLNTGMFFPAADTIAFSTNGTEDFRIGSAGQLGIAGANYGTSGQILTSGGASAAPSWVDPSSMTLLGTLTTTSGTTQTLTSLTLTGYRYLFLAINDVSATTTTDDLRIVDSAGTSHQLFADSGVADNVWNGSAIVNLFNGSTIAWGASNGSTTYSMGTGNFGAGSAGTKTGFGRINMTTASTSIGVSVQTAFDAGTVTVYGVR